jgi:hypothetical protein
VAVGKPTIWGRIAKISSPNDAAEYKAESLLSFGSSKLLMAAAGAIRGARREKNEPTHPRTRRDNKLFLLPTVVRLHFEMDVAAVVT